MARGAGILLHVTSLPGHGGIGAAGPDARRFIDLLAGCGIGYWQMLPVVPTGYADSPYSGLSAFAGNPLLISDQDLVRDGWLTPDDIAGPIGSPARVDYGTVGAEKMKLMHLAHERFESGVGDSHQFDEFREQSREWLDDFALFMALKDAHGGAPWWEWESPLKMREPSALARARDDLSGGVRLHRFLQFVFEAQWVELKRYANQHGVQLIGDMPIFVAHDSADVWARRELFRIDPEGAPEVVAGVPPDYFTPTGQLWGNPHYRWDAMRADGFQWWIARMRSALKHADLVRLDHFRGFCAGWAIPFGNPTAEHGQWEEAPGRELFTAMKSALGDFPLIVEDLGFITPDVIDLRLSMGWPGMQVLHFAFGSDGHDPGLPHNFERNTVVYTGTSDSDTTVGWFKTANQATRDMVCRYLGTDGADVSWDMARLAHASVADLAIIPMQDILRLGSEHRMNVPGTTHGNWQWRFTWDEFSQKDREDLEGMVATYGRDHTDSAHG